VRLRCIIAVTAVLVGCEHGGPFLPRDYAPSQPFNPPPLVRLTLNPGEDVMPTWLPSGDILFSAERRDRADRDRCLAVMRGSGGAITRYICRTTASNDSIDVFTEAAATASGGGGGQIAYVRAASYRLPIPSLSPDVEAIVVAPLDDPTAARVVRPFPYAAASGRTHWGVSHLRWLDSTRLVYVGEDVSYPRPCTQCPPDTVRVGLEITTLDLGPATPVLAIVPGTDSASSVAVGATSDTIYFTRENDAVLYRYVFSSGVTDSVHDFSLDGGAVARDAAWADDHLFTSVDGTVWMIAAGIYGPLLRATPAIGYRRPAPSSDARRVVIESQTASGARDLWVYERP
jgi:hypothetical protein